MPVLFICFYLVPLILFPPEPLKYSIRLEDYFLLSSFSDPNAKYVSDYRHVAFFDFFKLRSN